MKRHVSIGGSGGMGDLDEIVPPLDTSQLGFRITPDEERLFDRMDRKNGEPGAAKRARCEGRGMEDEDSLSEDEADLGLPTPHSHPHRPSRRKKGGTKKSSSTQASSAVASKDPMIAKSGAANTDIEFTKRYNELLNQTINEMMNTKSRMFTGPDDKNFQLLYGAQSEAEVYQAVDVSSRPGLTPTSILAYLTPGTRGRIGSLEEYDKAELLLRPIDIKWSNTIKNKALLKKVIQTSGSSSGAADGIPSGGAMLLNIPAGIALNITQIATFIESNTELDVWTFTTSIFVAAEDDDDDEESDEKGSTPTTTTTTPHRWIIDHFQILMAAHGNVLPLIRYGTMVLDCILDRTSVFHLRIVYVYGTVAADAPGAIPPFLMRDNEFEGILRESKIPQGESRIHMERFDIMRTYERASIFRVPVSYAGRYYLCPTAAQNIKHNSLESLLKTGSLLHDMNAVFTLEGKQ